MIDGEELSDMENLWLVLLTWLCVIVLMLSAGIGLGYVFQKIVGV